MKRNWIFLAVAAVALLVAIVAAAPFIAEMRTPPSESAGDEPALGTDPSTRERTAPHRRRRAEYAEFLRYLDERRADGKPTTLRELLGPDPPDADNAAVELVAALKAVTADVGEDSAFPKVGPWGERPFEEQTPEQFEELRVFVERLRPFCGRVAKALDRPRCRLPVPGGIDETFEDSIRALQRASRILIAAARADADVERRLEALTTLLRLARRNEPTTEIASMVNTALAKAAVAAIRDGIARNELAPGVVRARLDALLTTDWIATGPAFFELQFVGFLANARAWIDRGFRLPEGTQEFLTSRSPSPEELLAVTDALEEASRLPSSPYGKYAARADALEEHLGAAGPGVGVSLFVRSIGDVEAACRLARIALAAGEYRSTHDDFPASLDDLKPMFVDGVPLNPMTDAPLVYERTETGARLATEARSHDDADHEELIRERCLVWELKR